MGGGESDKTDMLWRFLHQVEWFAQHAYGELEIQVQYNTQHCYTVRDIPYRDIGEYRRDFGFHGRLTYFGLQSWFNLCESYQ